MSVVDKEAGKVSLMEQKPASFLSTKAYFRSGHPRFSIIDDLGNRHIFGDPYKHWLITEDKAVIDYIRKNHIGLKGVTNNIIESTQEAFKKEHTIQQPTEQVQAVSQSPSK